MKNYDDLRSLTASPRFLIVLDLPDDAADWIHLSKKGLLKRRCAYWLSLRGEPQVRNTTNKTIYIPKTNLFTPAALETMLVRASRLEHLS